MNDVMDVDNKSDYKEMVKQIHAGNPRTTKIFVAIVVNPLKTIMSDRESMLLSLLVSHCSLT